VISRTQFSKPLLVIVSLWSPAEICNVDGVFPENFPSTMISAPSGVDFTVTVGKMFPADRGVRRFYLRTS